MDEIHYIINNSVQQSNNIRWNEIIESHRGETAKIVRAVNSLRIIFSDFRTSFENRTNTNKLNQVEAKKTCAINVETILNEMSKVEDKCSNIFVFQLPKPKNGEKILFAIKILAELTIF